MKIAVVNFPGSSGAEDMVYAYRDLLGQDAYTVWHQEETLRSPDIVVIPGGASFGDYLRPGALTLGSPIIGPIRKFSRDGGPMIGIGNGFQILCESKILPGALVANHTLGFISRDVFLTAANTHSPFLKNLKDDEVISLPMACNFGSYWADKRTLKDLEENGNVAFRFCDREGDVDSTAPFNGSLNGIAAITSRHHNVLGIICHPERAMEELLGAGTAGKRLLEAVLTS